MSEQPDWAEQGRRLITGLSGMFAGPSPEAPGDGSAPAGGDCRWCPLCQAAAVLRGERPEVSAAVADLLASAATALRSFAGQADAEPGAPGGEPAAGGTGGPGETGAPGGERARPGGEPGVQRIEIA